MNATINSLLDALNIATDKIQQSNDLVCALSALSAQVEVLTKERDALALSVDQWRVDFHELSLEHDALEAAAKLAWVAIVELRYSNSTDKSRSVSEFAVLALREAGVQ